MKKLIIVLALFVLMALNTFGLPYRLYTKNDGLEGTFFNDIVQDSQKNLWICTMTGLNRFNGYNFKAYTYQPYDTCSLNSSYTWCIYQDVNKKLWVGTNIGLNLYNYQLDNFTRIPLQYKNVDIKTTIKKIIQYDNNILYMISDHGLIRFNTTTNIHEFYNTSFENNGMPSNTRFNDGFVDVNGNIWIGSSYNGVLIFNPKNNKFYTFNDFTGCKEGVPFKNIQLIKLTRENDIYIGGTKDNLYIYNTKKNQLHPVNSIQLKNNLKSGSIKSIIESKNNIWVGTEYGGINKIDSTKTSLVSANDYFDINNIKNSSVLCYKDLNGDLWFAINYIGLYHIKTRLFNVETLTPQNSALKHHLIKSFIKDWDNNLIIGTDGGGYASYHFMNDKLKLIYNKKQWQPSAVLELFKDSKGNIWIGSYNDGLACYFKNSRKIIHFPIEIKGSEHTLNWIFDIEEDHHQNLYIATNGSGLIKYNLQNKTTIVKTKFKTDSGYIETITHINDIILEENGDIWLATYDGLFLWCEKEQHIIRIKDQKELFNNTPVYCIEKGFNHQIYIGTSEGFYLYDYTNNALEKFTTKEGLCNNHVTAIIPYRKNETWISTSNGISKYNDDKKIFQNFNQYDGLPFNEFLKGAKYKDEDGYIYLGGVNGFIKFHPDSIITYSDQPNLQITNFKVLDKKISNNYLYKNRQILKKTINETDTIKLQYSDKSFSFEFAAIDFTAPEKIKYLYQLEGFDNTWIERDFNYRVASYSNIPAGTYHFKVKCTNTNEQWLNNVRTITILVSPPFWLTWWAYVLYLIILSSLFLFIFLFYSFRLKMKNKIHIIQIEKEKQESLNHSKFQFFTNISHDIRTPLSMILAPLEGLTKTSLSTVQKEYTSYILRNAKRMQRLINQLMEVQKIDNDQLSINNKVFDIVELINELTFLFEAFAKEKSIEVLFESSIKESLLFGDADKIDKILYNILSNAFKYSPVQGHIIITLKKISNSNTKEFNHYEFCIKDFGCGIKHENMNKVFHRFYQEKSVASTQDGTGIGLHIAKNLVELLNGTISVESEPNQGTSFKIILPLKVSSNSTPILKPLLTYDIENSNLEIEKSIDLPLNNDIKPKIIVVEDDNEILRFLEQVLSNTYKIIKASNGKNAWKLIKKELPELILSDVSMPEMSGTELCELVKTTFETSHIPVILLTAKVSPEHEIQGLKQGADAYIHKPFNLQILKLKIEKTIEEREKLRNKFSQTNSFIAKKLTATTSDELFLQRAINYVKDNLENANLSIEIMCKDLGISRVQFYRKIKALTNQVPTEFVRIIRLKQAAYLLQQNKFNISEIAYMVGFNSHQYFTKSFQQHFKVSPTHYALNHKKKD